MEKPSTDIYRQNDFGFTIRNGRISNIIRFIRGCIITFSMPLYVCTIVGYQIIELRLLDSTYQVLPSTIWGNCAMEPFYQTCAMSTLRAFTKPLNFQNNPDIRGWVNFDVNVSSINIQMSKVK